MSSREQRPYADGLGARARSHSRGHNRSPKQHKFVNQENATSADSQSVRILPNVTR